MDKKTRQGVVAVVLLLILLATFVVQALRDRGQPQPPPDVPAENRPTDPPAPAPAPAGPTDPSPHLLMGNPSGATDDPANRDNYLLRKPYFALSHNDAKGTANWASWRLRREDMGELPRANPFAPDPDLPAGFKRVFPRDYTGTGFDRGHLCPNADRDATRAGADATFVMTNMLPQAPNLNQRAWADLENHCRLLAGRGDTLYVVAGPHGQGGEGTSGRAETIAGGKVTVPARCWKVVLVVANGDGTAGDLGRVGADSRVIAVVMPNDQSVGRGWERFRTSVREVEALTGYRFFDRVPAEAIEPLKAREGD